MKRTFSFFPKRNALSCLLLAGLFFLVGNNMYAQEAARGFDNPKEAIAQDFNVVAYDLGTFNPEQTAIALKGILDSLEPLIGNGATPAQMRKYRYVTKVLSDVRDFSIAAEISLLTRLHEERANAKVGGSNTLVNNVADTPFTNMYNEVVNAL